MLAEMLDHLGLSVVELMQREGLGRHAYDLVQNIADYQKNTAKLSEADATQLSDALAAAFAALPDRRKKKERQWPGRRKRMKLEEHLHILLWKDFNDAVRVERYLADPRRQSM